ncbi:MAG: Nramp family divalent metal transporter [Gemmatimonadales bacterium]
MTIAPDDLRCPDDEGSAYRDGVYRPVNDAALPAAPDAPTHPAPGHGPRFRTGVEVPRVPRLRHLVGPSVIALGMGLGAGEFLLWPNLVAVNGFSIWWLFWVGVMTQFVVIAEIERWTIATGESVFGGMARLDQLGFWAWFFVGATLVSFFWPGWASQSAEFVTSIGRAATGRSAAWQPVALVMMAFIWATLALARVVYNALERFELLLVGILFPTLVLALVVAGLHASDVVALARGAVSIGSAPPSLLTGEQFPTLLLAVAYAGSGGTLLLAQSLWLRDKGFGMAAYQGRIAGLRGVNEPVSDTGYVFDAREPVALARFRTWMRLARRELLFTFVVLILLSVVITTLVVSATLGTGDASLAGNLSLMVERQAAALRAAGGRWIEVAFLLGGVLVLFSTQLAIVDTVTRIAGTVFYERYGRRNRFWTLQRSFFLFLTAFTLASMAIIWVSWRGGAGLEQMQPDFLVLIAGPFTIASMYLFTLVVGTMNVRRLPRELAPGPWVRAGLAWAGVLWGWFTAEQLSRTLLASVGAPREVIEAIAWHPVRAGCYALWLASLAWFVVQLFRARRPPAESAAAESAVPVAA